MIKAETQAAPKFRILDTVAAVERHRVATGELPASLDAVSSRFIDAVPLVPFDGQPLRYRTTNDGYVVYSIGENAIDDGDIEGANRRSGHIVMEVRH